MQKLISAILETTTIDPASGNSQMFHYRERFWNNFIALKQIDFPYTINDLFSNIHNISQSRNSHNNTKDSRKQKILYQEELPFYCILFYMYYCCKILKIETNDWIFSQPNMHLSSISKCNSFTKTIEWYIECYQEWISIYGTDFTKEKSTHLQLYEYIYGIPLIFQRFQYHKNMGKQLLFDRLNYLLKLYNKGKQKLNIPSIETFLQYEILHLKPTFVPNGSIHQKRRKDENQIKLLTDTRYIHKNIRNYCNISTIAFENLLVETKDKREKMTDEELLERNSSKFIASLFMAYANPYDTNDPLPYVNIHFIISYYCWLFDAWCEERNISLEHCNTPEEIELISSTLHTGIHNMINHAHELGFEKIYSELFLPYYEDAIKESKLSKSQWEKFLYDKFLNSITQKDLYIFFQQ